MFDKLTKSSVKARDESPGQPSHHSQTKSSEKSIPVAADWKTGIAQDQESESEIVSSVNTDSETESEFSSISETSSTSSSGDQQAANRAVKKIRQLDVEEDQAGENPTRPSYHPSKFCLTGVGTSLGFSTAVAGFAATTFLYDLMTRFPEKSTTETGVAFGAAVFIALGGTIICSTSMVFMIRELCKTNPG